MSYGVTISTEEQELILKKERARLKAKDKRLYETYGITLEEWNKMFEAQKGVCWICQTLPKSGILCVDHRHVSRYKKLPPEEKIKEVRSLLCYQCNVMLSKLERRKIARHLLNRINEYFKVHKIFGDI